MLKLDLKTHRYFYNDLELESLTKRIGRYDPGFNSQYWATREALNKICANYKNYRIPRHKEDMNDLYYIINHENVNAEQLAEVVNTIMKNWEATSTMGKEKGTDFDEKQKQRARRRQKEPCLFTGTYYPVRDIISMNPDCFINNSNMLNLEYGAYPDFMIFNIRYGVAATLDWLFMNEDKSFYVVDLKRYGKIAKYIRTYKKPLQSLNTGALSYCKLQVWSHAFMLEQFGYKCLNTGIINYNSKGYQYFKHGVNSDFIKAWFDYDLNLRTADDPLPELSFEQ